MIIMKKFLALVLVVIMVLGCCSAMAATTDARSNNLVVTVKQFEIYKNGAETGSIAKASTATTAVVAKVDLKDTDRAVSYTMKNGAGLDKTVPVASGSELSITAGDVMNGITKSQNVTVTVTANVTSGDGKAYAAKESVSITFKVVIAGEDIPADKEKDPEKKATTGDFTCSITGPDSVYEGDPIALTVTPSLTGDTLTVLGENWKNGVTYKIYVMKNGETVGAITATAATASYQYAVLTESAYTFWAVATLSF